jgi:hypothetical protein
MQTVVRTATPTKGRNHAPPETEDVVSKLPFRWHAQTTTVEGMPPRTARAGDVQHDEPMQVHSSENSGPVKTLTFRIVEKGKTTTVRVP